MTNDTQKTDRLENIDKLDLRSITQDSDKYLTTVSFLFRHKMAPWIKAGITRLNKHSYTETWKLKAYLNNGVTDFDESPALAFNLPLIGVQLSHASMGRVFLRAFIQPSEFTNFHIPPLGYDPDNDPKATLCMICDTPHIRTEHYTPPQTKETRKLFEKVRGMPVLIQTGLADNIKL